MGGLKEELQAAGLDRRLPGSRKEPDMKHWRETQEIVERAVALAADGRRAAIATVVRIEGSAYRRPCARLLIQDDGLTCGGVSGGCLEADVRDVALSVIQSDAPRLLPELAAYEGEGCGKQVVKRHRHEAESASWRAEALTDLDAP